MEKDLDKPPVTLIPEDKRDVHVQQEESGNDNLILRDQRDKQHSEQDSEPNNLSVFSIPQDQRDRLEDIRYDREAFEIPDDLDNNKKRWIIIGICIHSLVSPVLRKYIESTFTSFYQTLLSSSSINTQKYPNHYQPTGLRLFYDSINNNQRQHGRQFRNYDLRILNPVDLAKIHLESSMAKFTGFDESCDSSALLNLLINPCLPVFSPALRLSSQRMLTKVRNDWAHCNFDLWNSDKYQEAFEIIEALIVDLGLASLDENRALGELDKWAKNGHDFLSGTTLGLELVNEIRNQTSSLAEYVLTLTSESEGTIARLQVELKSVKEDLSNKITIVEKKQQALEHNTDIKTTELENEIKTLQMKLNDPVPPAIREQNTNELKKWKKKDKDFVSTRASKHISECVASNACVTITGSAGCGKTFLARHTALALKEDGYDIIIINTPKDIRDFYKTGRKAVFIVDDICGNFTASQEKIDNWLQFQDTVDKIVKDQNCKIIVSCRLQVYRDDNFKCLYHFLSCECNLISDNFCLSLAEKAAMIKQYTGEEIDTSVIIEEIGTAGAFLPLLCSLFRKESGTSALDFLRNPFGKITKELETLSNRKEDSSKYKICSLVLCVLFNNNLDSDWFKGKVTKEQRTLLDDMSDACKLNRRLSKQSLEDELNTLVGTFVIKVTVQERHMWNASSDAIEEGRLSKTKYKAIHDKVFDFLAWYFGKRITSCIIEHGDSDLIHERFRWNLEEIDKSGDMEYLVDISDECLDLYIERMVTDWSNGKVIQVFNNIHMRQQVFRRHFLRYLTSQSQHEINHLIKKTNVFDKNGKVMFKHQVSGSTALIQSILNDFLDMFEWLLSYNESNVNQTDFCKRSLLYFASEKGNLNILCTLFRKNPDVNLCNENGQSPLFIACFVGNVEIVSKLLEKNPDVNLCYKYGQSPLWIACKNGNVVIVSKILEKNPDPNPCDKWQGQSPLWITCYNGNVEIVSKLLEKDPDVNLCNKFGQSPLWIACKKGNVEIVLKLLEKNTDVNLCDKNGCSPLWVACSRSENLILYDKKFEFCVDFKTDNVEIVSKILEKNPNLNLCDKRKGQSPLWIACYNGNVEIVSKLLEKDPDVNLCDKDGQSPLWVACEQGNVEIVFKLLEKNPDVNLCNEYGQSPLWIACKKGNVVIVSKILEKNPDHNLCNK